MKQVIRSGWLRALVLGVMVLWVGSAGMSGSVWADDDANVNDVALPMDDPAAIELGKTKYGKCSGFCHGSGGKGARGPCIVCSSYKRGGKNSDLIRNIEEGVKGTPMGAFKDVLTREEILAVVAYLRLEQKKKREAEGQ
ncbi:MAG: c-type cytochrome [Burkholderiales bacterium]